MGELLKQTNLHHKAVEALGYSEAASKWPEVIKKWEDILGECPECPIAKVSRAWCYHETGEPERAAMLIEKVADSWDVGTRIYFVTGIAYKSAKKYDRAISYFKACISLFEILGPNHYRDWCANKSHGHLSDIYDSLEDHDNAEMHRKLFNPDK